MFSVIDPGTANMQSMLSRLPGSHPTEDQSIGSTQNIPQSPKSNALQATASMFGTLRAPAPPMGIIMPGGMFDGKRMRNKSVLRKTVDYNASITNYIENRIWQRDYRDQRAIQPDILYNHLMLPPHCLTDKPINSVTTKFVRQSTNKIKCPIFCVRWTPEGRRLVTGASSGEFTLWNGLTFNFETILQAHDTSVRAMVWSRSDMWMLTGDFGGYVKYWQTNMNNVKMYQAHKDPVRGLRWASEQRASIVRAAKSTVCFCPTDAKYASCSDDGTVRVWDFLRCHEERIMRGHGADVKCVDWHPQKGLLISGSKDTQQPVKLWDPRTGSSLATIHAHKNTVMDVKWNANGNWALTASRDHLVKVYDIRNMKEEMQVFRGHKKEATSLSWHPVNESMFASGGSDGALMFWLVGQDKEVGSIDQAHDNVVWSLAWHPLGHILASGSNDHSTKFWTRNRAGDKMRDRYNLNTLPLGVSEEADYDGDTIINLPGLDQSVGETKTADGADIPGLDIGSETGEALLNAARQQARKKAIVTKPVPKEFEQAWKQIAPLPNANSDQPVPPGSMGPPGPPGPPGAWPRHPGMRPPPPGFMDEQMSGSHIVGPGMHGGPPMLGPGMMPRPMMGGGPRPVLLSDPVQRPLLADPNGPTPRMPHHGPLSNDGTLLESGGPMILSEGPRGPGPLGPRMMMAESGPRAAMGEQGVPQGPPMFPQGPQGQRHPMMHGPRGLRPGMVRPPIRPYAPSSMGDEMEPLGSKDEEYENGEEEEMIPGLGMLSHDEEVMNGPTNVPQMSRGSRPLLGVHPDQPITSGPRQPWDMVGHPRAGVPVQQWGAPRGMRPPRGAWPRAGQPGSGGANLMGNMGSSHHYEEEVGDEDESSREVWDDGLLHVDESQASTDAWPMYDSGPSNEHYMMDQSSGDQPYLNDNKQLQRGGVVRGGRLRAGRVMGAGRGGSSAPLLHPQNSRNSLKRDWHEEDMLEWPAQQMSKLPRQDEDMSGRGRGQMMRSRGPPMNRVMNRGLRGPSRPSRAQRGSL